MASSTFRCFTKPLGPSYVDHSYATTAEDLTMPSISAREGYLEDGKKDRAANNKPLHVEAVLADVKWRWMEDKTSRPLGIPAGSTDQSVPHHDGGGRGHPSGRPRPTRL